MASAYSTTPPAAKEHRAPAFEARFRTFVVADARTKPSPSTRFRAIIMKLPVPGPKKPSYTPRGKPTRNTFRLSQCFGRGRSFFPKPVSSETAMPMGSMKSRTFPSTALSRYRASPDPAAPPRKAARKPTSAADFSTRPLLR